MNIKLILSVAAVILPIMSYAKTYLDDTRTIGTANHPTIEGGIINSTNEALVNPDMPSKKSLLATEVMLTKVSDDKKPFKDDWATNEEVKKLLIDAARGDKLNEVLKKTDHMRLPASVAVVPMVESDYQTDAVSSNGAAGAWQLMPLTAKAYGMSHQERFQFARSTDIALKLLNHLHQQFGNWELTFAAYNAGSNRVIRALRENPNATTLDELNLPEETKRYVKHIRDINKTMMELAVHGA